MKYLYLFFCLAFYSTTFAQIQVSTLVDNINASGGIKIDAQGNIIVADFGESLDNGNGRNVWKVTPSGEVSLYATGLSGASGNDFDSQGNLFQSNIQGSTVSKITPDGQVSLFVSNGISCNVGIAIDPEDNLYVCNCCGTFLNTIRKVTPDGSSTLFSSSSLFNCPNGITIDKDNNLYVSNFSNGNIIKITPDGNPSFFARTSGAGGAAPSNGHIVYSKQEEVLYVASHGSHRIYRLDMEGNLSVFAGTSQRGNKDGAALEATFSRPNGLALSHTGDTLYVNSTIPTTDAGGRPLNPSKIRMLTGLLGVSNTQQKLSDEVAIKISPNPTQGKIQINFEETIKSPVTIKALNSMGQIVKEIQQNKSILASENILFSFDENLAKGLYFIQIEMVGQILLKKVILQ